MTTVNAGRVELDLVAIARNQVSATLREADQSLRQTKAQMDAVKGTAESTSTSFSDLWKGMKMGAGVLATLGLPGVIAGVVSAIGDLVSVESEYAKSTRLATERTKDFLSATQALEQAITQFREETAALSPEEERVNKIREQQVANIVKMIAEAAALDTRHKALNDTNREMAEIFGQIQKRTAQIIEQSKKSGYLGVGQQEQHQQVVFLERLGELASQQVGYIREIQRGEENIGEGMKANLKLASETTSLYAQMANLAGKAALGLAGGGQGVRPGDELARLAVFRALRGSAAGVKAPTGGGGGTDPLLEWQEKMRKLGDEKAHEFNDRDFRMLERRLNAEAPPVYVEPAQNQALRDQIDLLTARTDIERQEIEYRQKLADITRREASGELSASTADLERDLADKERHAQAVDALATSYQRFAGVLSQDLAPILPGIGDAVTQLGDVFAQMAKIEDANDKAVAGTSGAIGALLGLAAAQTKNKRAWFLLRGAEEIAEAISTSVTNPVESASHVAGAIAFGVAAAAAGGGGGARGVGAGSRPSSLDTMSSGGRSGPSTIIYNVNLAPGTDAQAGARAVWQMQYSARGTGTDTRSSPGL